jgi:hypothetical protein
MVNAPTGERKGLLSQKSRGQLVVDAARPWLLGVLLEPMEPGIELDSWQSMRESSSAFERESAAEHDRIALAQTKRGPGRPVRTGRLEAAPAELLWQRGGPPYLALAAMLEAVGLPVPTWKPDGVDGRVKRVRRSRLSSQVVVRVLSVYLLSRRGGGELSVDDARELLATSLGLKWPDPDDANRESRRVRRMLASDFGWHPITHRRLATAEPSTQP